MHTNTRTFDPKIWGRWVGSFIGFPLAGLAARAVAGNIDDLASAAVGGLAGGAVLGAVQAIALRRPAANKVAWIAATALGLSIGLSAGAAAVDYSTTTGSLTVMGALSGLTVGLAQAAVLHAGTARRALWAVGTSALWALGWAITANVISDIDNQFATFGASGALVAAAVGGLVLAVRPERTWATTSDATAGSSGSSGSSHITTTATPIAAAPRVAK